MSFLPRTIVTKTFRPWTIGLKDLSPQDNWPNWRVWLVYLSTDGSTYAAVKLESLVSIFFHRWKHQVAPQPPQKSQWNDDICFFLLIHIYSRPYKNTIVSPAPFLGISAKYSLRGKIGNILCAKMCEELQMSSLNMGGEYTIHTGK